MKHLVISLLGRQVLSVGFGESDPDEPTGTAYGAGTSLYTERSYEESDDVRAFGFQPPRRTP